MTNQPLDEQLGEEEPLSRMQRKINNKKHETRGWLVCIVVAVAIALCLRFFVFEFIRIDGDSMVPALKNNEFVFMDKITFLFRTPERGDIIICSFPNSKDSFVKRVIGLPGDRLKITDGVLYINGAPNSDYFSELIRDDMAETTVPAGYIFAMGDNRNYSRDSRDPSVGPIPESNITGKAAFVIWPFDEIHSL